MPTVSNNNIPPTIVTAIALLLLAALFTHLIN